MDYVSRQERLQQSLSQHRLDALLLTHLPNIRYLCGFTGSAGALLLNPGGSIFFSDSRYTQQAKSEVQARKIVITKKAPLAAAASWLGRRPRSNRSSKALVIGIEAQNLTVASRTSLSAAL